MRAREWIEARRAELAGEISFGEPLSKHTYYRIGGPADVFAIPKRAEDLEFLGRLVAEFELPYFILGAGSNLLVSDEGFRGLIIRTHRMNLEISDLGGGRVRTGASVMVFSLLAEVSKRGWGGLEFMTGIPGTMGGVAVMNGGTHLGEACDRLEAVEWVRLRGGARERVERSEFKYSYRHNGFIPEDAVVWSLEWSVRAEEPAKVKALVDETLARRKSTQPIDKPSCGSVFKNPRASGMHAWQVMDKLGLRGHRIGDAQFSEKHSNFIVNLKGARAADVRALIELAKQRAREELGVTLEEEVRFVGEFSIPPR